MDTILVTAQYGLAAICVVAGLIGLVLLLRSKRYPRARHREIRCGSCPMWQVMEMDFGRCGLTGDVKHACHRACRTERKRRLAAMTRQMIWSEYATTSTLKIRKLTDLLEQMEVHYVFSYQRTGAHVFTMLTSTHDLRTIHGYLGKISRNKSYGENIDATQKLNPQIDFGA